MSLRAKIGSVVVVVYRLALLSVAVVGLWALLDCRADIRRAAQVTEDAAGNVSRLAQSVCPADDGLLGNSLLSHGTSLVESVESMTEKLDSIETDLSNIDIQGVQIRR